jgi:hypothetical protein
VEKNLQMSSNVDKNLQTSSSVSVLRVKNGKSVIKVKASKKTPEQESNNLLMETSETASPVPTTIELAVLPPQRPEPKHEIACSFCRCG